MPKIPVLNKRKDKIPKGAIYVGRPSIYGNPFPIRKGKTREEVIEKYREYFKKRSKDDLVFMAALKKLKDATALVCFCAPLPCHADILAEWVEENREA